MTTRRIVYGLAAMVGLFVIGTGIGATWDDSDAAGALTVTLWIISAIGAVLLIVALALLFARRRPA